MIHVQGSLAIAKHIKQVRPDIRIIFGGISSTYFSDQLIRYPFVDMVMRGYDTHQQMLDLLGAIDDDGLMGMVPNLLWKSDDGQVYDNGMTYVPKIFGCGVDWTNQHTSSSTKSLSINELLSVTTVGCTNNCNWCGGSRNAFRRIFNTKHPIARKNVHEISREFDSIV